MIRLSSIIQQFERGFLTQYGQRLLPSHRHAMAAMKGCRTQMSPKMHVHCTDCDHEVWVPHSCGHRHCPHCQHHESQQWLERQLKRQLPADYFLITFTLPAQFRPLAWQHQRKVYGCLFDCAWQTLKTFSENDQQLQGIPGAIAVLHSHTRRLDYHPHVHVVIPAAAIDKSQRLWRCKRNGAKKKPFLFSHKALAKVFRAKMLAALTELNLPLPERYPRQWVVDCTWAGNGEKALVYLGRYLYRGVIQEKQIIACDDKEVTYEYINSKTGQTETQTLTGEAFLWQLIQHVLPRRFRRARNFGFLHPNSKQLINILQLRLQFNPDQALAWIRQRPTWLCRCCGGLMVILETWIAADKHRRRPQQGGEQSLM